MITNIILGAILGIIIVVFRILNVKVNNLLSDIKYIKVYLNEIDEINCTYNKLLDDLFIKFNNKILKDNEFKDLLERKINTNIEYFDKLINNIYNRLNTIDSDTQNLIIAEHRCTRNEIKKKAKISSKINSKTKTSKSINK